MTALVEHGIVGAVLYVWLTLWGAMAIVRVKALQRRGVSAELTGPAAACCAGIAVVWSAGQFTDYLHAEVQFWLLAALAASLEQLRRTVLRPKVGSIRNRRHRRKRWTQGVRLDRRERIVRPVAEQSGADCDIRPQVRRSAVMGWGPRMRLAFDYFTPDDQYEAIVAKLVKHGTWWADIGCGRDVFPSNPELAKDTVRTSALFFSVSIPTPTSATTPSYAKDSKGWSRTVTPVTAST